MMDSKASRKSFCADAKVIYNSSIAIGDRTVEVAQLSCATPLNKRQTSTSGGAFGDVCTCIVAGIVVLCWSCVN